MIRQGAQDSSHVDGLVIMAIKLNQVLRNCGRNRQRSGVGYKELTNECTPGRDWRRSGKARSNGRRRGSRGNTRRAALAMVA